MERTFLYPSCWLHWCLHEPRKKSSRPFHFLIPCMVSGCLSQLKRENTRDSVNENTMSEWASEHRVTTEERMDNKWDGTECQRHGRVNEWRMRNDCRADEAESWCKRKWYVKQMSEQMLTKWIRRWLSDEWMNEWMGRRISECSKWRNSK